MIAAKFDIYDSSKRIGLEIASKELEIAIGNWNSDNIDINVARTCQT